MKSGFLSFMLIFTFSPEHGLSEKEKSVPPHIIIIVIDDLGWNDVPWNNPDSLAVHLGDHARSGIIFNNHYVHASCSPSRAALLTGRYAWKMGMQRGNIEKYQPLGLSKKYKLLPQYLKSAGYVTHAVGKWHLGYCNEDYLPTRRGFDTFFGMYSDSTHYRSRMVICDNYDFKKEMIGYDLRRNESVTREYHRRFAPNMYSKEARKILSNHDKSRPLFLYLPLMSLQSPHVGNAPKRFRHLYNSKSTSGFESSDRMREVLLMTVDFALHKFFEDLKKTGLYSNSVVLVTTDSGGEAWQTNRPLRGTRDTYYQGGIRGVSFLTSPLLGMSRYTYPGMIHLVDWVPTLLEAAGVRPPPDLDGVSMWSSLSGNLSSPRQTILHNIDRGDTTWQAAISHNQYKLLWGQEYQLSRSQRAQADTVRLYNINTDPQETANIATDNKKIVQRLKDTILKSMMEFVPPLVTRSSRNGWPSNFAGVISPGWCEAR